MKTGKCFSMKSNYKTLFELTGKTPLYRRVGILGQRFSGALPNLGAGSRSGLGPRALHRLRRELGATTTARGPSGAPAMYRSPPSVASMVIRWSNIWCHPCPAQQRRFKSAPECVFCQHGRVSLAEWRKIMSSMSTACSWLRKR